MCQSDFNLKFCTCTIESEKETNQQIGGAISYDERLKKFDSFMNPQRPVLSEEEYKKAKEAIKSGNYYDTKLIWTLNKFKGNSYTILGVVILPTGALQKKITFDYILKELIDNTAFDFDYIPEVNDVLKITEEYTCKEISEVNRPALRDYMFFKYYEFGWGLGRPSLNEKFDIIRQGELKVTNNS